jgi:hypothetical protein
MIVGVVVGACLAVACVLLVALPFLREPAPESDTIENLSSEELAALELAEARDRALAALKELEADHRAGRIADPDYRALVGPLRREVAEALRALDRPSADGDRPSPAAAEGARSKAEVAAPDAEGITDAKRTSEG